MLTKLVTYCMYKTIYAIFFSQASIGLICLYSDLMNRMISGCLSKNFAKASCTQTGKSKTKKITLMGFKSEIPSEVPKTEPTTTRHGAF